MGVLQLKNEELWFDPDNNFDPKGIVSRDNWFVYQRSWFKSWHQVMGFTFDRGSNYTAAVKLFPACIQEYSGPCIAHRHSCAVKAACN